jgi:hypothetical protein
MLYSAVMRRVLRFNLSFGSMEVVEGEKGIRQETVDGIV